MEIKEGDFVLVFNEDRGKKLVGKITSIKVKHSLSSQYRMMW